MAAPTFTVALAVPSWQVQAVDALGVSVSTLGQSVSTLQYVRVVVRATVNGVTPYNPTADVVAFGFQNQATVGPSVVPSSWITGAWETDVLGGLTSYVAKLLTGPGGAFVPTAATNYWLWLKVTDNPEIPVMLVGELRVT